LRESLAELIASEGFGVRQAGDGEQAIQLLRNGSYEPDIVFLDVRMPKLGGLEVLGVIQAERTDLARRLLSSVPSATAQR
jgi:CheY-like chemotaxis protein